VHGWKRVEGLGKISAPLAVVDLEGAVRVVVSPWAAIGTDALGMGASTALFFATKNPWLKILAGVTGTWMTTALVVELLKLLSGPEKVGP
jgi:hypothetical protein